MKLSRNLKVRLATSFINRTATSAINPFMTLYFAIHVGIAIAGLVTLLQIIISYFSNLLGGYIGDNHNEKILLLWGQMIHGLLQFIIAGSLLFKWNSILTIALFFISVFIGNIYKATFTSLLVASVDSINKKLAFTLDYLSLNISLAIGVIIGGIAFDKFQFLLFVFSGFTIFFTGIVLYYFFIEVPKENKISSYNGKFKFLNTLKRIITNYSVPIRDIPFRNYVIGLGFVGSASLVLSNSVLVNLKKNYGILSIILMNHTVKFTSTKIYSLMQTENVVIVVLLTLLTFKLFQKVSSFMKIGIAGGVLVVSYSAMTLVGNPMLLLLLIFIGSVAEVIFVPETQALQADLIPLARKSSYVAFNMLGNYLAQGISAIGVMVLNIGQVAVTLYTAIVGLIGVLLLLKVVIRKSMTAKLLAQ